MLRIDNGRGVGRPHGGAQTPFYIGTDDGGRVYVPWAWRRGQCLALPGVSKEAVRAWLQVYVAAPDVWPPPGWTAPQGQGEAAWVSHVLAPAEGASEQRDDGTRHLSDQAAAVVRSLDRLIRAYAAVDQVGRSVEAGLTPPFPTLPGTHVQWPLWRSRRLHQIRTRLVCHPDTFLARMRAPGATMPSLAGAPPFIRALPLCLARQRKAIRRNGRRRRWREKAEASTGGPRVVLGAPPTTRLGRCVGCRGAFQATPLPASGDRSHPVDVYGFACGHCVHVACAPELDDEDRCCVCGASTQEGVHVIAYHRASPPSPREPPTRQEGPASAGPPEEGRCNWWARAKRWVRGDRGRPRPPEYALGAVNEREREREHEDVNITRALALGMAP